MPALLKRLQHLFTPHHTNNHRPRILHPAGLAIFIGLFIFFNSGVKLVAQVDDTLVRGAVLGYASSISVEQVVELTNLERSKHGLKPLTYNSVLSNAATLKAGDMFSFDYWAHNNPQTGRQPWDFIKGAGYTYRYAGENLARDFGDTSNMMSAWMASPSHKDNILSDRYSEIGIAVVNGSLQNVETTLVVQMFGEPTKTQATSTTSAKDNTEPDISEPVAGAETSQPLQYSKQAFISPDSLIKALSLSILILALVTLLADQLITKFRKTIRVSSKNLAHILFISALIIIVLSVSDGGIL